MSRAVSIPDPNVDEIALLVPVVAGPVIPGWWLLAGSVLVVGGAIWVWSRRRREGQRHALREALLSLEQAFLGGRDHASLAVGLCELLRRVAPADLESDDLARLDEEEWLDVLASAGHDAGLPGQVAQELEWAVHAGEAASWKNEGEEWIRGVREWIRENA